MIGDLLFLSIFVMCASHTIAKEDIFKPLREYVKERSDWFGALLSCPYCLSHWLAFGVVAAHGIRVVRFRPSWPAPYSIGDYLCAWPLHADFFVTSIVIVAISATMRIAFYLVDEGQGLLRQENKIAKVEAKEVEKADDSEP